MNQFLKHKIKFFIAIVCLLTIGCNTDDGGAGDVTPTASPVPTVSPIPTPDPIVLSFKEVQNDGSYDITGLDPDFVANLTAKFFTADLNQFFSRKTGDPTTVNIFNVEEEGILEAYTLPSGGIMNRIDFGAKLGRMSIYFTSDNDSEGEIYAKQGRYVFIHNGQIGVFLSRYEAKKSKHALRYD